RLPVVRLGTHWRCHPQPGRHVPARGHPARGARGDRRTGARRAVPSRRGGRAVAPPRPGTGGGAPAGGARAGGGGRRGGHRGGAPVKALAEVVTAAVNLDAVLAVARAAPAFSVAPWSPAAPEPAPRRPTVAVAGGPAFSFGYAETVELLAGAGAEVALLDPVHD